MPALDLAHTPVRLARPSKDLSAAENFWVSGLGLDVLWRTTDPGAGEHHLLMIGAPHASWHLELVLDPDLARSAPPSAEDLLVIYLGAPVDGRLVERLRDHGGAVVAARNPYWDRWGVTIEDPDGYRLVLSHRTWG